VVVVAVNNVLQKHYSVHQQCVRQQLLLVRHLRLVLLLKLLLVRQKLLVLRQHLGHHPRLVLLLKLLLVPHRLREVLLKPHRRLLQLAVLKYK
jgi:hypothetical protein